MLPAEGGIDSVDLETFVDASMGPRVVTRGRRRWDLSGTSPKVPLQWGRGLLPAEGPLLRRIRGAEGSLQWGRGLLPAEGSRATRSPDRACSFNGAAGCYPRKVRDFWSVSILKDRLQWGRGLLPAEGRRCEGTLSLHTRLQWGRGLLPAEGPYVVIMPLGKSSLQWGRGLLPAEGAVAGALVRRRCCASMGPRVVTRGRQYVVGQCKLAPLRFNGAAGCYPRKASVPTAPGGRSDRFNGAAGCYPRKVEERGLH